MINRDKRSKVLSMCFGDGCLHYIKTGGKLFGGLTIDHGLDQIDYLEWKAKILREITGRNVNVRQGHRGNSAQVSVCMKRFRYWRKRLYPGGIKDISEMLRFITDSDFLIAVWFMDDGYTAANIKRGKLLSIALRLYVCSETPPQIEKLLAWLKVHYDVTPKIKFIKRSETKKDPFLQFSIGDSMKLWKVIREYALQMQSMRHKFRYIEQLYTSRFLQPPLSGQKAA